MKRTILFCAAVLLLMGCATSRKTAKTDDVAIHSEQADTSSATHVSGVLYETESWDASTYTRTIIRFVPDTMPAKALNDRKTTGERPKNDQTGRIVVGGIAIETTNALNVSSVEHMALTRDTGERGRSERNDSTANVAKSAAVVDVQEHQKETATPVRVVNWWMVGGIALAVIAAIIAVWLKRASISAFIKRVWTFARMMI